MVRYGWLPGTMIATEKSGSKCGQMTAGSSLRRPQRGNLAGAKCVATVMSAAGIVRGVRETERAPQQGHKPGEDELGTAGAAPGGTPATKAGGGVRFSQWLRNNHLPYKSPRR